MPTKKTDRRPAAEAEAEEAAFKVADRRHWSRPADGDGDANGAAGGEPREAPADEPRRPSIVDEYRARAEQAEAKLQEYIEAYKGFRAEQDQVRARLERDVDRRVERKFADLVEQLLASIDHLDLALDHARDVPEAQPLADGVRLARDGFLQALLSQGVERVDPLGAEFDPNEAEAVRMDPVDDPARSNTVTEVLRPGFRLGGAVIRPARVAVGRAAG